MTTPDRLAVIVPTRGRPDNVRKVLAAWDFTNAWEVADLYLAADSDDPEIEGYRQIAEQGWNPKRWLRISEQTAWVPMVVKLNDLAALLAESAGGEDGPYLAVAFAGDDHLPRTINWAQRYLTVLGEMGTGMVYGDDGYQGEKLSTEWAVTADAVRALGEMVPAPVDHLYCDNAMMDLYGGAGALRHLPEIRIEHMHPVAGKARTDAQYDRVNGREQYREDRRKYEMWKTTEGPNRLAAQIEIIRQLRADRPEEQRPGRALRPQRQERAVRGSGPRPVQRSGPSRFSAPPKSRFPFPPAFRNVRGATPDEIAFTLADFAKAVPADQEIVELGVFQARTALIMAWGAAQGNGAHVTAIDLWDSPGNTYGPPFTDPETREAAEANVRGLGYADQIRLVQDFAVEQASEWAPRQQVGLLFVDDDHSAEGARAAIEAWAPHLAAGAVIAVDDYGHPDWPGVAEAVDALVDEGFLAPIEIFHDRLAVMRLAEPQLIQTPREPEPGEAEEMIERFTAITSEGVAVSRETESEPDDGLDALTLGELRRRVKAVGHTGFSGLGKAELIALLRGGQ